jgi:hypothetical protein
VRQNLENGSFILVVVVDEINEELKQIIRYINECSKSTFSLHALEMNRFQADSIEILVPHLHGNATKPPPINGKRSWNEETLLKVFAEKNPSGIVSTFKDLYRWTKETADRIWLGQGKEKWIIHFSLFKSRTNNRALFSIHRRKISFRLRLLDGTAVTRNIRTISRENNGDTYNESHPKKFCKQISQRKTGST